MPKATRHLVAAATAVIALLPACTTFVRPTACPPGATACGGIEDARFCESTAISVEGADCAGLGIAPAKPFCVVTAGPCVATTYAVEGRDCRVARYERLRDSARDDCPLGAPIFIKG